MIKSCFLRMPCLRVLAREGFFISRGTLFALHYNITLVYEGALDMKWWVTKEARSAELVIIILYPASPSRIIVFYVKSFEMNSSGIEAQNKQVTEPTLKITLLLRFNNSFKLTIQDKRWDVLRVTPKSINLRSIKRTFSGEFIPPAHPKSFAIVRKAGQRVPPNRYFLLQDSKTVCESLFVCSFKFIVMCPFMLLPVRSSN